MPAEPTEPRIKDLVVARESNASDLPLLEGMIYQTHQRYDLPGRERLLDIGVRPVQHPHEVNGRIMKDGGTRAVLFAIEGTTCLYSQGSAAADDAEDGDNVFVTFLCEIIDTYRPKNLYVATFSRLVRSFYHASPLYRSIKRAGTTLHYGEGQPLNLGDPYADLRWSMLATFAEMERTAIVTRLMLGRIGKHRKKVWLRGSGAVPIGYDLDRDRRLIIDPRPGARDAVRKAIRMMGDPNNSMMEIGLALGRIGVSPPRRRRGERGWKYSDWQWDGQPYVPRAQRSEAEQRAMEAEPTRRRRRLDEDDVSLLDYSFPETVAKRIIGHLDLLTTGRIRLTQPNPISEMTRWAEYRVHTDEVTGKGYLVFDYEPGVPDGGWAPPEELAEARAVRDLMALTETQRAQTLDRQMPLLGDLGRWNEDGHRYGLISARNSRVWRYDLYRIPLPDELTRKADGTPNWPSFDMQGRQQGERLARVQASELHAAVAISLTRAINDGTNVKPHPYNPPSTVDPTSEHKRFELATKKAKLEERVRQATSYLLAPDETSDLLRRHLIDDTETALTELADIDEELETINAGDGPTFPNELAARPNEIAQALAVLARTGTATPRDVTRAMNSVLSDLRLHPDGTTVKGSIKANIPVGDGLLVVGPVDFEVQQRMGAHNRIAHSVEADLPEVREARYRDLTRSILTTEQSVADIRDARSHTGQVERKRVLTWLQEQELPQGGACRLLETVPPSTRAVLWHHLSGEPLPGNLAALDPAFIRHVIDVYSNPIHTHRIWWGQTHLRWAATRFIAERGGTVTYPALAAWLTTQNAGAGAYATLKAPTLSKPGQRVADRPRWATFTSTPHTDRTRCNQDCATYCETHRLEQLHPCPRPGCNGLLEHHLPIIELTTGLLCSTCRREPTNSSPTYPPDYLNITTEAVALRRAAVNPRAAQQAEHEEVTRTVREKARLWAIDNGLITNTRRHIPVALVDRYTDLVARGELEDTRMIRDWAKAAGLEVNTRGPLPEHITVAYRRHLVSNFPRLARTWAANNGYGTIAASRIPDNVIEAFVTNRPATDNHAE